MTDEELMRIAFSDKRTVQEILRYIFELGEQKGRADKYKEITSEYMLLTEKQVAEIRADAIDEFLIDVIYKIEFEEKWLMKAKSDNADTNVMFSCLKTFCKERAEQLKGAEQ